jgi:hypothetical protein
VFVGDVRELSAYPTRQQTEAYSTNTKVEVGGASGWVYEAVVGDLGLDARDDAVRKAEWTPSTSSSSLSWGDGIRESGELRSEVDADWDVGPTVAASWVEGERDGRKIDGERDDDGDDEVTVSSMSEGRGERLRQQQEIMKMLEAMRLQKAGLLDGNAMGCDEAVVDLRGSRDGVGSEASVSTACNLERMRQQDMMVEKMMAALRSGTSFPSLPFPSLPWTSLYSRISSPKNKCCVTGPSDRR